MALTIRELSGPDLARHLGAFGDLLHACVEDGASIGFVLPFSADDGVAYWLDAVLPAVRRGDVLLLTAWQDDRLAGAVQLSCDTPANQPHRAEVRKLLVHPAHRRRGIARALMLALEERARLRDRCLITLDTRTGDPSEPLYTSLGFETSGIIPGYCRDTVEDRFDPTTVMYKTL